MKINVTWFYVKSVQAVRTQYPHGTWCVKTETNLKKEWSNKISDTRWQNSWSAILWLCGIVSSFPGDLEQSYYEA